MKFKMDIIIKYRYFIRERNIIMNLLTIIGRIFVTVLSDVAQFSRTCHSSHRYVTVLTDMLQLSQTCHSSSGRGTVLTDMSQFLLTCHCSHGHVTVLTNMSQFSRTCHSSHGHVKVLTTINCPCSDPGPPKPLRVAL